MADPLRIALGSTIGLQAAENQDSLGVDGWLLRTDGSAVIALELDASRPHVIAVADGMGGYPGGRRAAEIAAAEVSSAAGDVTRGMHPTVALEQGITRTRTRLDQVALDDPAIARLGTTVIALLWNGSAEVQIAQVGDSMAYRYVDDYLGAVVEPQRIEEGPSAGSLTDYLGAGQSLRGIPEFVDLRGHDGSRFVLCTDGVWDLVSRTPDAFAEFQRVALLGEPQEAVESTLDLVNILGADDNASIAIVQVPGA